MQPILDTRSKWQRLNALGQRGVVILTLFLGLGVARADTTNFTGDFAAAFWTNSPSGFGSVSFANANTELELIGANNPPSETKSLDGIIYNGYLGGGLAVGGTVQFDYQYTSLDDGNAWAEFSTSLSSTPFYLGNGQASGAVTFFPPLQLPQGATFSFLLYTDTDLDKGAASLVITDFQFHPDIPEPSTGALVAGMLVSLGAARWRRCRRQGFEREQRFTVPELRRGG
jgi:hypothetical protein